MIWHLTNRTNEWWNGYKFENNNNKNTHKVETTTKYQQTEMQKGRLNGRIDKQAGRLADRQTDTHTDDVYQTVSKSDSFRYGFILREIAQCLNGYRNCWCQKKIEGSFRKFVSTLGFLLAHSLTHRDKIHPTKKNYGQEMDNGCVCKDFIFLDFGPKIKGWFSIARCYCLSLLCCVWTFKT